jgi:hypothetical protein
MPMQRGTAGMNAEPSCKRHDSAPVSLTARLARKPRTCPKAVHICQDITRAPRIEAGAFSEPKTGTVVDFTGQTLEGRESRYEVDLQPIPMPMSNLVTKSCSQVWASPEPMTGKPQNTPAMKIDQRRPVNQLTGSVSHTPMMQDDMNGAALIRPTIHGSIPSGRPTPRASGNERLAPLDPV